MHDPSIRNPAYLALTDQQLSEIDELCDRFDQELVREDGPRIESFLADAPEAARDGLLAELLVMEFEYRTQQRDEPRRDEYSVVAEWVSSGWRSRTSRSSVASPSS